MHPDVEPLAGLLGTWAGEGAGTYPTIEPFRYREEVVFGHVGKPFLTYRQTTVNLGTGLPAHAEVGYLRTVGDDRVELVLAHPTGIAEVAAGTVELGGDDDVGVDGTGAGADADADGAGQHRLVRLHLMSSTVALTSTAKAVTSIERRIELAGDVLRYDLSMGAVDQPHQHHLSAELHRQP